MELIPFDHTSVGFRRAKRWLKHNRFRELLETYGSDATAVVDLANEIRNQHRHDHSEPDYKE